MKVKIINKSKNSLPKYATSGSAGMDLMADLSSLEVDELYIRAGDRILVPTGIYIQLPEGYEAQIRPRSGMSLKHGITVLNTPGTIDADYTSEIGVILINNSNKTYFIKHGDRIAQMVISKYEKCEWVEVDKLNKTERGSGGFGSTGR